MKTVNRETSNKFNDLHPECYMVVTFDKLQADSLIMNL
jgi:hypothetical protein